MKIIIIMTHNYLHVQLPDDDDCSAPFTYTVDKSDKNNGAL